MNERDTDRQFSPVISEFLQLLLTAGESVVGGSVFEPWLLSFNPGQELYR